MECERPEQVRIPMAQVLVYGSSWIKLWPTLADRSHKEPLLIVLCFLYLQGPNHENNPFSALATTVPRLIPPVSFTPPFTRFLFSKINIDTTIKSWTERDWISRDKVDVIVIVGWWLGPSFLQDFVN